MISLFQQFAAGGSAASCAKGFFGLPTWYAYLPTNDFAPGTCNIAQFHYPDDFGYIVLAAVDIALAIAGMAAVFFVIYGGIQYVISQGEPDKTRAARNTITNALVGLVISGAAYTIVSFIGSQLG